MTRVGNTLLCPLPLLLLMLSPFFVFPSAEKIQLPDGFVIEEFASDLGSPRFMAFSPDGVLFSTIIRRGEVVALPDEDRDNKPDKKIAFLRGLNSPHGLAFHKGYLYVAETDRIVRYKYSGIGLKPGRKQVIVPDLPAGGHFTRTVAFGPDGKMYVSIGSSCNVCNERDRRRAAILQFNPDGSGGKIFAKGLRNSVGLAWDPMKGEMWATENGRDWLGDDLPPEEINLIREGEDYGWPYCYGDRSPDPEFNDRERCRKTVGPAVQFQAHSAPLGLTFYYGNSFPKEFKGDLFVAYHGSWNRSVRTGYKIVRIRMRNGKFSGIEDFATGWLRGNRVFGRPVDVIVGPYGALYVSDDRSGKIYKITYRGEKVPD